MPCFNSSFSETSPIFFFSTISKLLFNCCTISSNSSFVVSALLSFEWRFAFRVKVRVKIWIFLDSENNVTVVGTWRDTDVALRDKNLHEVTPPWPSRDITVTVTVILSRNGSVTPVSRHIFTPVSRQIFTSVSLHIVTPVSSHVTPVSSQASVTSDLHDRNVFSLYFNIT